MFHKPSLLLFLVFGTLVSVACTPQTATLRDGREPIIQQVRPSSPDTINKETQLNKVPLGKEGWEIYNDALAEFSFSYPSHFLKETLPLDKDNRKTTNPLSIIRIYSPEAAPSARSPEDITALEEFNNQYTFIALQIYDNQKTLPLAEAIKQIYLKPKSDQSIPGIEIVESNLHPLEIMTQDALMFKGILGENPQKSVFFLSENKLVVITLMGGPEGTGSNYSAYAEEVFDSIITSITVPK